MPIRSTAPSKRRQKQAVSQETVADAVNSAKAAGLRYVTDASVGIRRVKAGKTFRYVDTRSKTVSDASTLARIKSLVIPPAWREVWICPRADGHLQAVGIDARGRKQYRYHPDWRKVRDEAKYGRMTAFADALPKLRRRIKRDLKLPGLPRDKVLAAIVRLLETTFIRVGNAEYARTNKSYGLTTIHNKHVKVRGSKITFEFRGKSGVEHEIDLEDANLAKIVRQCQELPEQELFEYVGEDGKRHDVSSTDVNEYIHAATGQDFTAKDFRTWAGTVLASLALQEFEAFDSQAQAKKNIVAAVERVAKKLGNTKAVCRKCYIHPAVIDSYLDGTMVESLKRRTDQKLAGSLRHLRAEEATVLALLQERLKHEVKRHKKPLAA